MIKGSEKKDKGWDASPDKVSASISCFPKFNYQ